MVADSNAITAGLQGAGTNMIETEDMCLQIDGNENKQQANEEFSNANFVLLEEATASDSKLESHIEVLPQDRDYHTNTKGT